MVTIKFFEYFLGYILMLLTMTFNGYVILAVVLGLTFGYILSFLDKDLENIANKTGIVRECGTCH